MLQNHLKVSLRHLTKNKGYTLINITGLALGIFGSLLIFQLVKFHLSTDTHHHKADRIYRVVMDLHLDDGSIEHEKGSPFVLHTTLKNDFSGVENVAYIGQQEMTILIPDKNGQKAKFLEKEAAAFISASYFNLFDYQWITGNPTFLDAPNTIVLTKRYATKYFGKTNPINQLIHINGLQPAKVVGIVQDLPETTDLGTEVFVSLPTIRHFMSGESLTDWQWFMKSKETYVLLKDNFSEQAFEAQLPAFSQKYYGEMKKSYHYQLQPLSDIHFNLSYGGKISRMNIYVFSVIGILLIVIACINFINLATAQSIKRFKEIGIRKTLGGSHFQLFRQFITEFSVITCLAAFIALFCTYLAIPLLNNWFEITITIQQFFDAEIFWFLPLLIVFTILIAGFYPSIVVAGYNPLYALKGIKKKSKTSISLRKGLIITQFGIANGLVIVSIAVILQVNFLQNKDIGSIKDLIIHIQIPDTENLEVLKNKIRQKNYVESISFLRHAPSSKRGGGGTIKFENRDWEKFAVRSKKADENYLDTYQIKLVAGRKPVASDTVREILINQKLAKDLGLKVPEEALNKRLLLGDANKTGIIVGVTTDFNNADLYTAIEPTVIYSAKDEYSQVAIRLNKISTNVLAELSDIWESLYPNSVYEYSFYDHELAQFYKREQLTRNLVMAFSVLAIFISCLGLLGLISLAVSQRTKEIGIRKVLGASVISVLILLSKDFVKLVVVALAVASPIAFYFVNQWLADFAYRIDLSWWIFALAGMLVTGLAILTVCSEAIKAALANPVKSLRNE